MSGAHPEVGPELRRLAQAILNGVDPTVRAAAAFAAGGGPGTGKCQQVWCPVCALAAVVTGEQHPLVTVIADHSVALLEVIRAIISDISDLGDIEDVDRATPPAAPPEPPTDGPGGGSAPADPAADTAAASRYQSIPVNVEE